MFASSHPHCVLMVTLPSGPRASGLPIESPPREGHRCANPNAEPPAGESLGLGWASHQSGETPTTTMSWLLAIVVESILCSMVDGSHGDNAHESQASLEPLSPWRDQGIC